jgi:hypothetical protein
MIKSNRKIFERKSTRTLFGVRVFAVVILMIGLIFPLNSKAQTGPPALISFQGRLMDSSGNLLGGSGTDYCFKFALYDASTGGSKVWPSGSPSDDTLTVREGVFDAYIGSADTLDFDFQSDDEVYVSVQVSAKSGICDGVGESYEELTPRQRVASAGYAINSGTVGGFTPAQSATDNQLPALTSGLMVLGHATAAGISSVTTAPLSIDTGTTGTLNLGTGNNAKTINLGTGTAGNAINIGTDNTTQDTITIGSALDSTAITSATWAVNSSGVFSGLTGLTSTGVIDFGSATSFELPNSATPTVDADGEIAFDTTVTDWTTGVFRAYGNEEQGLVAMPIAEFTSPTDGYVVAYNGTNDEFELVQQSEGANTALSNLASVAINTTLVSDTDNTDALGTAAIGWSDLYLGNGSVITWSTAPSTADVTLTHSANTLTLAGGDLALGANNLTMTGSLAATGARVTKGWFTDIESTNEPTVGGTSLSALSQTFTNKTIQDSTNILGGVTMTLGSDADYDMYYRSSNVLTRLANGTTGQVLTATTSAAPSWGTLGAASITDDSLDYAQFQDTMDLDAALTLNQTTNTWSQTFTGTTTTGLSYTADSLTSGSALAVASSSTGLTGSLASVTLSGSNAANTGPLLQLDNTGTSNTNTTMVINHYATGTNNLAFRVNDVSGDTTPFVIDGDGNVGIGDTTPAAALTVGDTDLFQVASDGSIDAITGLTGATGTYDFGGVTSLEIPNSATPTVNADGEIAFDTTVTDFTTGLLRFYGNEEQAVVSMPVAQYTSPTDGYVVAYNGTNDEFELVQQSTTPPGGSDTQIQFNDGGSFGGDSYFTWNKTTNTMYLGAQGDTGYIRGPNASTTNFAGSGLGIYAGTGDGSGAGGLLSLYAGGGGTTGNGGTLDLYAGNGGGTSGTGGSMTFTAGSSNGASDAGDINLVPGWAGGSGAHGQVALVDPSSYIYAYLDTSSLASSNKTFTFPNATGTFVLNDNTATLTNKTISGATLTGVLDAGGATSLELPNSATPTVDADGEIAFDTTVTDWTTGVFRAYGNEEQGLVAMPIAEFTSPTDGYVVAYNGTNDEFELVQQSEGANTALSNLASVAINTTLVSDTDNTDALGTAAIGWSDLYLGNGSVITWSTAPSTADVTLTHSANTLTLAGGDLALGANNLTMTGSLAATGARVTKGWFTDIESTNEPTVGGTSLSALSQTFTNKTIQDSTNILGGVTMTLGSDADYDMYYRSSNVLTRLANGTTGQVLTATTSAAPSWGTLGAASITADSLDFSEFENSMDIDEATDIDLGANAFTIDMDSTGSFSIRDVTTDIATFANTGAITFAPTSGRNLAVNTAGAGAINLTSAGTGSIVLDVTNTSSTSPTIWLGNTSYAVTGGTKYGVYASNGFAPTSGTGVFNALTLAGTINQTGGANGITRGLYINPTLTAAADYRAVEIAADSTSAFGIYQSGSNTENYFAGNTGFGDTSPTALLTVGSGDLFQVNSSGAIAAATGLTSSGTITFSGLSDGFVKSTSGVLSGGNTISLSDISDMDSNVQTWAVTPSSANLATAMSDETGSGALVFGTSPTFTTQVTLTPVATPTTDADGEIAVDIDAWATGRDAIEFYDGTASTYLIGTLASDIPTNGQVPKWNTGGTITWEDDGGGITEVSEDTSPQLGGNLDSNDFEIYMSAGKAVTFDTVASDGMSIYHTSPNSYIDSWGGDLNLTNYNTTGNLNLVLGTTTSATKFQVQDSGSGVLFSINGAGAIDAGMATSFELPNSATPTVNADGEIAFDTTVTDFTTGLLRFYGNEEQGVVSMPVAQYTSPTDGYVVAYNATNDEFELVAQSGASTWNSLSNPTGTQSLTFDDGELNDWTISSNTETFHTYTANSLTTGKVIDISSTSLTSGTLLNLSSNGTGALSSQTGLNISLTGTNASSSQKTYGAYISNTHDGTSSSNVALYLNASGGTTSNLGLNVDNGQTLLGGTTLTTNTESKLNIVASMASNGSTTAIAGIHGEYTMNPTSGGVQIGNRFVTTNSPTTSANTTVNTIVRTVDNTSLANLVRGIEVTSNAGSNTAGTNTGIRTTGATFGIQAKTTGLAGGVYIPAAIYGESTGTTQGDILRLYTNSMTTAPRMAYFYHDTSTFSGTGLLMDFATGSGSFTGDFADFQKNNTTMFKVTNAGVTSVTLTSSSNNYALCHDTNGTGLDAIQDCSGSPSADYAEMYPVSEGINYADIVAMGEEAVSTFDTSSGSVDWEVEAGTTRRLVKANKAYQNTVVGIVVDNYGDFSSTGYNIREEDNPMPVALSGRVPVRIAKSSEYIKAGDYITTSIEEGRATKAKKAGFVIGKALEDWDPEIGYEMIMVYVEQGYYNGISMEEFMGLTQEPGMVTTEGRQILAKIVEDENSIQMTALDVSEIFTDRLVAGLEVVTPTLLANAVEADRVQVKGEAVFEGLTTVSGNAVFANKVTFGAPVEFNMPPVFNKDTAGFAVIKEGGDRVRVDFENTYAATPVVTASITYEATDNIDATNAKTIFDQGIQYIVTNKDVSGFTILINKNAPQNIRFSWIALGMKDANIFESVMDGLVIESDLPINDNGVYIPPSAAEAKEMGMVVDGGGDGNGESSNTEEESEDTTGETTDTADTTDTTETTTEDTEVETTTETDTTEELTEEEVVEEPFDEAQDDSAESEIVEEEAVVEETIEEIVEPFDSTQDDFTESEVVEEVPEEVTE